MSASDCVEVVYRLFAGKRLTRSQALELIERLDEGGRATSTHLHPPVHQNTSTLREQRFTSSFSGDEFYFRDHVVDGRRVLPGVAFLEMAQAAFERGAGFIPGEGSILRLRNIVWARPLAAREDGHVKVHVCLSPETDGYTRFEICTESSDHSGEPVVHCQGAASFESANQPTGLDLVALCGELRSNRVDASECYAAFEAAGIEYGPTFRGVEEIFYDSKHVLAKLHLPDLGAQPAPGAGNAFSLHPAVLDAALQACICLSRADDRIETSRRPLLLPFALDECDIFSACTPKMWSPKMWSWIRRSAGSTPEDKVQKVDIDLCSEDGQVCVRLKGLSSRAAGSEAHPSEAGAVIFHPVWRESERRGNVASATWQRHLILWCDGVAPSPADLQAEFKGAECISLESGGGLPESFEDASVKAFEVIRSIIEARSDDATLVQILVSTRGAHGLFCGLSGLLRTARLEQPRVVSQLIEVDPDQTNRSIVQSLRMGCLHPEEPHIRFEAGRTLVRSWRETIPPEVPPAPPWKDRGVYLITGGAAGLSLIFAREIAARTSGAVLILVGRSSPGGEQRKQLQELESLGVTVSWRQVDVRQASVVEALVAEIISKYGGLNGVIHSAGVIQDEFLLRKTVKSFREVLGPKVTGTLTLDHATRGLPLDLFVLFSSNAGVFGNAGQADYATANAFLNAYATYRNGLVESGERRGYTTSICWPLWAHGGMQVDDATRQLLVRKGILPLQTGDGIDAFYRCLASGQPQCVVAAGELERVRGLLAHDGRDSEPDSPNAESPASVEALVHADAGAISRRTLNYLRQLVSETLKLPVERIEPDTPLEQYGIDSIAVMRMTNKLEETFGSLSKTLFFEYRTLGELGRYFLASHAAKLHAFLSGSKTTQRAVVPVRPTRAARSVGESREPTRVVSAASRAAPKPESSALDIAIIGLSGRYPESRDLTEFWQNLRAGKDCITEIPPDRWDWRDYYTGEHKEGGHDGKWGGFIADVDKFDPLFFGISPREAEFLDPQERLFLEHAWMALEDAGYRRVDLQKGPGDDLPAQVGVYAGVMFGEYQLFGVAPEHGTAPAPLNSSYSSIANRVSYVLNLNGPSMTVDTMCSSSLTSLYLACQDLKLGRTDLALAGGVNVSIHPNKYCLLSGGRFLSTQGRCASFGQGGDGYVPGEGVGVAVLKRLADAERDGDHIYGVIKGAAVNHGGRTNAYTVPNPNAQQMVIGRALRQAGIEPREVTYVEAHGTGTELGDPIEVTGLTKAFGGAEPGSCWIGSVKSNIGHCESAAGIAAVTKVLLQMKYGEIVPSLHSQALNPKIDFEDSPFVVNQALRDWERPPAREGKGHRIAGISSFGAGGSNAHLVIAEYVDGGDSEVQTVQDGPHAILLSAKNEERLKEYATSLLSFVHAINRQSADTTADCRDSGFGRIELENLVRSRMAEILEVEAGEIDAGQPFDEFGVDAFQERRLLEILRSEFMLEHGWSNPLPKVSIVLIVDELLKILPPALGVARSQDGMSKETLRDLAYTLQIGREAMGERLALLAGSMEELEEKLDAFLGVREMRRGQRYEAGGLEDIYRGQVRRHRETIAELDSDEDMLRTVETWINKRKYDKLLGLWVKGLEIDWRKLYGEEMPRRISLPTYPFARERYWAPDRVQAQPVRGEPSVAERSVARTQDIGPVLGIPVWKDAGVSDSSRSYSRRVVVTYGFDSFAPTVGDSGNVRFSRVNLRLGNGGLAERYQDAVLQTLGIVRGLLEEKGRGGALLQLLIPAGNEDTLFAGIAGLLRTAHLENPKFFAQVIEVDRGVTDAELAKYLEDAGGRPLDAHIRYVRGQRQIRMWQESPASAGEDLPLWRDRGVYLITGGAGELGLIFAQEIAMKSAAPALILTGRSPLTAAKQERVEHIRSLGAQVDYLQVDVSDYGAVADLIAGIEKKFRGLNGIVHSAGAIRDSFILKKTPSEVQAVLAAKVAGTVNLDQASANQSLDFMVLFSSAAGSLGNAGQSDYAASNAFMDLYAGYRNELVTAGKRFGRTLSIGWPLWESGGMQVNPALVQHESETSMTAMPTAVGIQAFYAAFRSGAGQAIVLNGPRAEIRRRAFAETSIREKEGPKIDQPRDVADRGAGVVERLKVLLGDAARIPADRIDSEEPLESYGIDSVMITQMNQRLESVFTEIPKTLFFEHRTLAGVAGYLEHEYPSECLVWSKIEVPHAAASSHTPVTSPAVPTPIPTEAPRSIGNLSGALEPIAIVGISGRYPQADTLDIFWENLKSGRDCIAEIPGDRWPIEGFYEPDPDLAREQGKSYSKWGGFLNSFAEFDPLFFGISPREALAIDPQERLFLQTCWEALENAGYTRASLREDYRRRVGVFAGITKTGFDLYGPELRARGHVSHLHTSFSSAANRVSWVLDLRGPSMPIDTMCSASLTAIHEACEHLRTQRCEMAIAGGVNLYLHPSNYCSLSALGALSAGGRCRSFGEAGDGFVPGEGVGAVVLKPLSRAIADRDTIYALIRATGVNHNGKTNGYTVPNPEAQGELIREVLNKAEVSARDISYVEAHGTGTILGDPIEIAGLSRAYRDDTDETGFCALGSVKSNMGHLEAAAGIAALTKVLLQMKHGQLAPTLHATEPNPNINFARSPFVLQRELGEWRRQAVDVDGHDATREKPRMAGISSFGAGGSNAHVVVEEYIDARIAAGTGDSAGHPHAFVLSARNEIRLREMIANLRRFILQTPGLSVCDLAFTLQIGREAMDVRLGIIVATIEQLSGKLAAILEGLDPIEGVFRGQVLSGSHSATLKGAGIASATVAAQTRQYEQVLSAWVQGQSIDWMALYSSTNTSQDAAHHCSPRRIGLPTYPFARDRYWVAEYGLAGELPQTAVDTGERSSKGAAVERGQNPRLKPTGVALPDVELVDRILTRGNLNRQNTARRPGAIKKREAETKEFVEVRDHGGGIVELRISKPDSAASAVRPFDDLTGIFDGLRDRSDIAVVLISGADDVFLSGGFDGEDERVRRMISEKFLDAGFITIAAMKGDCLGIAWLFASFCDFLICSHEGLYGLRQSGRTADWTASPEVRELIERRFGPNSARRFLFGDRAQTGRELLAQGMGMPVLDRGEVDGYALALATELASMPRLSLSELKRCLVSDPVTPKEEAFDWLKVNANEHPAASLEPPKKVALSSSTVSASAYPDGVLLVTLRDEAHKNMYSADLCRGIAEVFAHVRGAPRYKVVVLTGYDHYFACGGTRNGVLGMQAGATKYTDVPLYELPLYCEIPVVAAMQGHAIGAGWAFGMFCDAAVFGAGSIYTSRFMKLGFTPGFGSTMIFPDRLGRDLAWEVLFTARDYRGAELAARNTSVPVFPRAAVLDNALKAAHRIALSPRAELIDLKARHSRTVREFLNDTISRELAMHQRTFVGNETALAKIEQEFALIEALGSTVPSHDARPASESTTASLDSIVAALRETLAEQVLVSPEAIDGERKFSELGLDSIIGVMWVKKVNSQFGLSMPATIFYRYPTLFELAAHVLSLAPAIGVSTVDKEMTKPSAARPETASAAQEPAGKPRTLVATEARHLQPDRKPPSQNLGNSIAVVGMSGRFPMARTLDQFWKNLEEGKDCISEAPESRWSIADFYDPDRSVPGKTDCKWMGVLEGAAEFDPLFFNISPRDAVTMDPQQRLFLEACWHCIEDAGRAPDSLSGSRCGVFVGCAPSDYGQWAEDGGLNAQRLMGGATSILAARVSYALNLQGPCLSIDTACSSSLVAIANACDSLILRHSDIALAGGVCVLAGPSLHVMASKAGMLSQDGRCFTFDQRANGFVPGEGVGVVLLKRLEDAIADRDPIHGVIRGWGINQDGKTNGITAPNPLAQTRLEEEVYRRFNIDPGAIQLVEAHGTGTKLGDPIEVDAIRDAFRQFTAKKGYCAIGSVKSNIGHLITAAGVSGVIKVLLALRHRRLPPTVNYRDLNEHIAFEDSPFYVNTVCRDWEVQNGAARLAAVSSFGFSGTNAHIVIEEHISATAAVPGEALGPVMIVLSAKKEDRLRMYAQNLLDAIRDRPSELDENAGRELANIAWTLQIGRTAMPERLGFVVASFDEFNDRLEAYLAGRNISGIYRGSAKRSPTPARTQEEYTAEAKRWIAAGEHGKLLEAWVNGASIDWKVLYRGADLLIVRLPVYPFAAEEYWMAGSNRPAQTAGRHHEVRANLKRAKRVCVVGAGPAGLVMAKSLLEEGHQPVVYEKQDRPGGLWNLRRDKIAGAYQKTRFQTSRYTSVFSDFFPAAIDSHFYGVDDVSRYLDLYAKKFQLDERIACNTEVVSVEESGGEWSVSIRRDGRERREVFDGVALCQGIYWNPWTPAIPGIGQFRGEIIHSGQYYDNAVFRNKRVLIVGNGISGMDLAEEASQTAREVVWNMRSLKLVMPRMTGFVPNDFQSPARLLSGRRITDIAERLKFSMPDYYELYRRSGLLPSDADIERHPVVYINDAIIRLVAEGKVRTVIGDIRDITANGCRFEVPPYSLDSIDLIAFCTGYETGRSFDYLKNIAPKRDFAMGIFFAKNPTLVNTSCLLPVGYSGTFFFPEMVSRWYARLLSGSMALTEQDLRHRVTDDYAALMGPLASVIFGLRLGLLPKPEHAFSKFWQLLNLPPLSAIYSTLGVDRNTDATLQRLLKSAVVKSDRSDPDLLNVKWRILAGLGKPAIEDLLKRREIEQSDFDGALRCSSDPIVFNWDLQYMKRDRAVEKSAEDTDDTTFYSNLAHRLKSRELDAMGLVAALGGNGLC